MQCIFIIGFAILYKYIGGINMAFQLKPDKKETENKTIRFPIALINNIEEAIKNQNVTFSRFVIQACEYALENIETNEDDSIKDDV